MANTQMFIETGVTLTFGTSSWSPKVIDVTPPNQTRPAVDVSHQASTAREHLPGKLVEGGELRLRVGFDPSDSVPIDGDPETVTITFPDSDATSWTFTGFLTNYAPAGTLEDKMVADITVKVTGAVTA